MFGFLLEDFCFLLKGVTYQCCSAEQHCTYVTRNGVKGTKKKSMNVGSK
jgi:hypothetical protein